jgi:GDP-4-dehydro-6-deoxy-D-mannose reductase
MVVRPVDLTDTAALLTFVQEAQPDVVFHLAGFASGAGTDRNAIFHANVEGTRHLLHVLANQGRPCRVQLASSGYVYGTTPAGSPATESTPVSPSGAYAESKVAMEAMAKPFSDNTSLSLTVTRSFNHTGPRQNADFVIPAFARQIARIEKGLEPPVVRHGNLDALRDFLHVRDVVRAYRLLLCETESVPWRVVNVASGLAVRVGDLLDRLIVMASIPVTQETDPARMRPSDLPECIGDSGLLHSLTGWSASIPIETTLAETLDWWRHQRA